MRNRLKSAMKTFKIGDRGRVISPCPECYETQGGMLFGTVADTYKGMITALCLDCSTLVDYYIDSNKEELWKLEPVEVQGYKLSATGVKTKLPKSR